MILSAPKGRQDCQSSSLGRRASSTRSVGRIPMAHGQPSPWPRAETNGVLTAQGKGYRRRAESDRRPGRERWTRPSDGVARIGGAPMQRHLAMVTFTTKTVKIIWLDSLRRHGVSHLDPAGDYFLLRALDL